MNKKRDYDISFDNLSDVVLGDNFSDDDNEVSFNNIVDSNSVINDTSNDEEFTEKDKELLVNIIESTLNDDEDEDNLSYENNDNYLDDIDSKIQMVDLSVQDNYKLDDNDEEVTGQDTDVFDLEENTTENNDNDISGFDTDITNTDENINTNINELPDTNINSDEDNNLDVNTLENNVSEVPEIDMNINNIDGNTNINELPDTNINNIEDNNLDVNTIEDNVSEVPEFDMNVNNISGNENINELPDTNINSIEDNNLDVNALEDNVSEVPEFDMNVNNIDGNTNINELPDTNINSIEDNNLDVNTLENNVSEVPEFDMNINNIDGNTNINELRDTNINSIEDNNNEVVNIVSNNQVMPDKVILEGNNDFANTYSGNPSIDNAIYYDIATNCFIDKDGNQFYNEETNVSNVVNDTINNNINNTSDYNNVYRVKIVKEKPSLIRMLVNVLSYAIFILLLVFGIILLFYFVDQKVREARGDTTPSKYNAYVVLTGSMIPTIDINDVVITKYTDPKDLKKNDIITFFSEYYNLNVTHRIIEVFYDDTTNEYMFKTRGDNNNADDFSLLSGSDVYGKVIIRIPKLGYIQNFLAKDGGWIIVILIPCLAILSYDIMKLFKMAGNKTKILK